MMQGRRRPGAGGEVNGNVANYRSQDSKPKRRGPVVFNEPQKLHKMLASPSARLHALVLAERRRSDATRRTLEDLLSRIDDVDVFKSEL